MLAVNSPTPELQANNPYQEIATQHRIKCGLSIIERLGHGAIFTVRKRLFELDSSNYTKREHFENALARKKSRAEDDRAYA